MRRSRVFAGTIVLAVAGLVACASARIATTDGSLVSPTSSGTPTGSDHSSPLPAPAFSAPAGQHIRVTVAQGCPATLPWAITDVENPADPALTKALAPAGAISGVICRYASDNVIHFPPGANTDVDTPAPLPVPNLRASIVLAAAQAGSLSAAAAAASIAPATGSYSCPMDEAGHDALIVLGYSDRADVDLWYSDTGCQDVDNGYASDFLLAGGDFGGAVDALVAAPSEGPATPSASAAAAPSASGAAAPSASG